MYRRPSRAPPKNTSDPLANDFVRALYLQSLLSSPCRTISCRHRSLRFVCTLGVLRYSFQSLGVLRYHLLLVTFFGPFRHHVNRRGGGLGLAPPPGDLKIAKGDICTPPGTGGSATRPQDRRISRPGARTLTPVGVR